MHQMEAELAAPLEGVLSGPELRPVTPLIQVRNDLPELKQQKLYPVLPKDLMKIRWQDQWGKPFGSDYVVRMPTLDKEGKVMHFLEPE